MSTNGTYNGTMNTSMVKSKFLKNQEDLGVVAVGFSGGQVSQPALGGPSGGKRGGGK